MQHNSLKPWETGSRGVNSGEFNLRKLEGRIVQGFAKRVKPEWHEFRGTGASVRMAGEEIDRYWPNDERTNRLDG
jgi:hypothetical protein